MQLNLTKRSEEAYKGVLQGNVGKLGDPKMFGKTLPLQFKHPMQIVTSPHERSEVNRADLINHAEEMLMTKSLIFDFEDAQKRKHARSKAVKQYAEDTFGYGSRVSTTKSPRMREHLDSKHDNYGKSIALGTSTLSLQKPNKKLSTVQRDI